jgi:hypothetical protein
MRRTLLTLTVLSLVAAPAIAKATPAYCSPTGDFCMKIAKRDGRVFFDIGTFSFRDYSLCVTPPRGRGTCHDFRLRRRSHEIYRSVVRWDAHYANHGAGTYAVRWKVEGSRIGPVLSFRRQARAANAAARPLYLKADSRGLVTIGGFHPLRDARLRAAIRALGEPSGKAPIGNGTDACTVRWSHIGLIIKFANFGGGDACAPGDGFAQVLVIKGSKARRWQTSRGLRLGDSVGRLRRLHPAATQHPDGWWLATKYVPYGQGCPCPDAALRAKVSGGRVSSFRSWLGGAGD